MSIGLGHLEDLIDDNRNEEISKITKNNDKIENKIESLDKKLDEHASIRTTINSLKIEKDKFIIEYINKTYFPKELNLKLLNYKALLFYFIDNFTYKNTTLEYENFPKSDDKNIYLSKKDTFKNLFVIEEKTYSCNKDLLLENISYIKKSIKINVNISNFPHLIGYKDNDKSTKDEFIRNIMYESNLSHDYETDGCDKTKIKAFSWILDTLKKPHWVFDSDAIIRKNSKLNSDIIFVRKFKTTYHYVSLEKHLGNINNEYYINSHHFMGEPTFKRTFNDNKKIYYFKEK
jgi:hypothetical protein